MRFSEEVKKECYFEYKGFYITCHSYVYDSLDRTYRMGINKELVYEIKADDIIFDKPDDYEERRAERYMCGPNYLREDE